MTKVYEFVFVTGRYIIIIVYISVFDCIRKSTVDSKFCVHTISDTIIIIEAAAIPVHLSPLKTYSGAHK